jgi:TonB family protein
MRITSVTCRVLPLYLRWLCMGYTALLFCPDEKTARTVTQVLSELEFAVEACAEPFAAVKKLMGQHFDAVVVDCDNEQNATLLFKSARNSTSNQTSLAVAVVEGQAGVAKAFRIGANLVLTKPINIEQAKGTLRVARGLLRKSEPAKAGAPAVSPTAAISKPVPKPALELKKIEPVRSIPDAPEIPVAKTTPAWPTAAAASASATVQDDDLLGIDHEVSAALAAITNQPDPSSDGAPVLASDLSATPAASKSSFGAQAGSGAASAAAPAREVPAPPVPGNPAVPEKPAENDSEDDILAVDSQPRPEATSIVGSAPTFTFGAAEAPAESSGGSKKIFIGIAAIIIVAVGLYAGWAHFHGSADQPANNDTSSSVAPAAPQPVKAVAQPPAAKTSSSPAPSAQLGGIPTSKKLQDEIEAAAKGDSSATGKSSKLTSSDTAKLNPTDEADEPEAAPLVVKSGKVPSAHAKSGSDAPAPSLSQMAAPGAATAPPTFISSTGTAINPTLQTVSVSQGVSRGLLIKKVAPTYPPSALRLRVEGTVELQATISKTGEISRVKVLSGDSQLSKAATDAVKQWKYKPYLLNGEPVEIQTDVSIIFKLPR